MRLGLRDGVSEGRSAVHPSVYRELRRSWSVTLRFAASTRAGRLAAAAAFLLALSITAWPVARAPSAGASPGQSDSALDGHFRTYANGDRPNCVVRLGDVLWVGTEGGGLLRWDLVTRDLRQYLSPQDGLPSNDVNAIAAAPDGGLWLGTARGLVRFRPEDGEFHVLVPAVSPGMPARNVTALLPAADGRLWVGFAQEWDPDGDHPDPKVREPGSFLPGGLARYTPQQGTWDEVSHVQVDHTPGAPSGSYVSIPSDNITALATDSAGRLWVGTRQYFVWEPEECVEGACTGVGQWVPAGGGLAANQAGKWMQWVPTDASASNCYSTTISDLAVDEASRVWVATRGRGVLVMRDGLTRVGCSNQVRYAHSTQEDAGLQGGQVWSLAFDARGDVWMAHGDSPIRGRGIAVLDYGGTLDDWASWQTDDTWRYLGFDGVDGRSDALITVMERGQDGTWLLGAKDDANGDGLGLRIHDEASGLWTPLRASDTGPPSSRVSDIAVDPGSGAVWFSLRNRGVARLDPATNAWSWWRAYQNVAVVANTIAVAETDSRRIQVDLADQAAYERAFPSRPAFARVGADPTLYEVTGYSPRRSGAGPYIYVSPVLAHSAAEGAEVFAVTRGPASNVARKIAVAPDGSVWVGGGLSMWRQGPLPGSQCEDYPQCWIDGGLGRWDGAAWSVYNDSNSRLPTNGIGAIEVGAVKVDAAGRVWAATGDGNSNGDGVGVLDPSSGQWQLHRYADGVTAGDGAADIEIDPVTGNVWMAHHPVIGYISLPNGQQLRYFDGGGASRWDGSAWRSWTKPNAPLRLYGDKGIAQAVAVDRPGGRVWIGGWDGDPNTYHWGLGRDVDASVNWCPLEECTDGAWSTKVWPDDGTVAALAVDASGRVWAGTNRSEIGIAPARAGVKLLAGDEWGLVSTGNSDLADDEVSALAADGERMWIGTLSRGVSLYLPGPAPTATPRATATSEATATSMATEPTPTSPASQTATATATSSATPTPPITRRPVLLPLLMRR